MSTTIDMPIALTGGVVYLLMALTIARMLRGNPQVRAVRLWAAGALCFGLALLLVAGRGHLPVVLGFVMAAVLGALGAQLQTATLRALLGLPQVPRATPLALAAALVLCAILWLADERRGVFALVIVTLAAINAQLAWYAWLAARQLQSGSAALLAWSHAVLALALLARAVGVATGMAPYRPGSGGATFVVLHVAAVLAALYGSMGFMGLMLNLTRRAERMAREDQVAEAARREVAEQTARDLRDLLQQRDALSAERERLLQMLAHEIRQPLHNASGALQAAHQALRQQPTGAGGAPADPVAQRLGRAEAVLTDVRSVLDNTLAAATLLQRSAPLALQEIELEFLVALALGDLTEAQRARVQVVWQTDLRHADLEPGLLRLALRNLLTNAFLHGGKAVQVQLQVAEQHTPAALLLRVVDDGPGLPDDGLAPDTGRRPGLGLSIVRQVMALHRGSLSLESALPQGLRASLVLPLPAA